MLCKIRIIALLCFFFFNDTATTEIFTLSLHDALPISIVRITGSGMGCGDHWPLCNGRLLPPLGDLGTLIEWNHRLAAALVSILVVALAGSAWWLRRDARSATPDVSNGPIGHRLRPLATARDRPGVGAYVALALLLVQVGLGAVTGKLALPPWTGIL